MKFIPAATLALILVACATQAQDKAQEKPLKLDAKTQARLQLRLAPVQPAHSSDFTPAFATVVDATPLLTLLSDLATAQSALTASQAEAVRTKSLSQDATVSLKAAEAAQAQARADQAKVSLLKQRLGLEWGAYFAGLSDAGLRQLSTDIVAAKTALVRIDTPSGQGLKGARSATLELATFGSVEARVLGIARTADQRLQSPGLMSMVTGPQAAYLNTGLTLKASLYSGSGTEGLLIPNAALLRQGGAVYAYVKSGPQGFDRRKVKSTRVTADGLIVNDGFKAGDMVVVQGAAALLTAETSTPAGE